jgi:hypothetical protein
MIKLVVRVLTLVALLISTCGSLAQAPAARPAFDAFEVAAIKPSAPDDSGGRFITMQGGHRFVVKNYTLKRMVGAAYNLTQSAISGGPD